MPLAPLPRSFTWDNVNSIWAIQVSILIYILKQSVHHPFLQVNSGAIPPRTDQAIPLLGGIAQERILGGGRGGHVPPPTFNIT